MLWAQFDSDTCCCRGRGSVAWFPVHCTSINNTNDLISGDNKGVAAQLFKRWAGSQVLHSLSVNFALFRMHVVCLLQAWLLGCLNRL